MPVLDENSTPAVLTELDDMFDDAVAKQRGVPQLLAIIASEVHKLRVIQEAASSQHWEWPTS